MINQFNIFGYKVMTFRDFINAFLIAIYYELDLSALFDENVSPYTENQNLSYSSSNST